MQSRLRQPCPLLLARAQGDVNTCTVTVEGLPFRIPSLASLAAPICVDRESANSSTYYTYYT
jgi:hypothetical protein